jgi:hypothetical protein
MTTKLGRGEFEFWLAFVVAATGPRRNKDSRRQNNLGFIAGLFRVLRQEFLLRPLSPLR